MRLDSTVGEMTYDNLIIRAGDVGSITLAASQGTLVRGSLVTEEATDGSVLATGGSADASYVGPSLPHGLLKCNTVFTGTKDEILTYINEAVQEYPEVERLMIPTDKVATIKTKIKTPGNLYNNYSEKIKSLIAQKGGNR